MNDALPNKPPITSDLAPAGSQVTCENGHYICRAAVDLRRLTRSRQADFDQWHHHISVPAHGDPLPLRCTCGAPYLKGSIGQCVHLEGFGWWPRDLYGVEQVARRGADDLRMINRAVIGPTPLQRHIVKIKRFLGRIRW